MKKLILAGIATVLATAAQADYLPEAKLKTHMESLNKVYAGVGMTNRLAHTNAELVTPYGIGYVKAGVYTNGEDFGAIGGFRFPYHLTGTDQNGYYIGVYGGQTENAKIDNEQKMRLGGGVDLAYVMLNKQRISTASVGVGANEPLTGRYGTKSKSEPKIQFAYTLSFGIF